MEFLVNEKGDLKFRFINDKGDNVTQDEFMMVPATAYSISEDNHEVMKSFDMKNDRDLSYENGITWRDTIRKNYPSDIFISYEVDLPNETDMFME